MQYNKQTKNWIINKTKRTSQALNKILLDDLTEKEKRYFSVNKLGSGWQRLPDRKDPLGAIFWIHENLTPDEFEQLCCAMLSHHGVQDVKVSEKRASGADGGLDGFGRYKIGDQDESVAMQYKKFRPDRQIGTDDIQKFIGTIYLESFKYGFFITSSVFSDRAIEKARIANLDETKSVQIELLDKHKIIDLLLYRGDAVHGYGLHKTDLGWYYLNPELLRRELGKF